MGLFLLLLFDGDGVQIIWKGAASIGLERRVLRTNPIRTFSSGTSMGMELLPSLPALIFLPKRNVGNISTKWLSVSLSSSQESSGRDDVPLELIGERSGDSDPKGLGV